MDNHVLYAEDNQKMDIFVYFCSLIFPFLSNFNSN